MDFVPEHSPSAQIAKEAFPMRYEFVLDAQRLDRAGTQNVANAFRLGFWFKDHFVGRATREAQAAHPLAMGLARVAEFVFFDIPVAAEATVIPHEVFGHAGRIREFGGTSSFHFELPPPYSFSPSATFDTTMPDRPRTTDMNLLMLQAGILTETHTAHAALLSSFEANTLNHIDSGLLVGIPIHEFFEATLPFANGNDVSQWTRQIGARYRTSATGLQETYLLGTAIAGFLNPTFLYSLYDVGWRFLAKGKRTGTFPSLKVGPTAWWANWHVSPTPWGLQYEFSALGRLRNQVLEVAPRWGQGPGGRFVGVDTQIINAQLSEHLCVDAGAGVWMQPELKIEPELGGLSARSRARSVPGAAGHLALRWREAQWFTGVRVDAKSAGLHGLSPIASGLELTGLIGVRPGRP